MNELKKLAIEALATGLIDSDENGNVSAEIFGKTYSIKVNPSDLEKFEADIMAAEEVALQEIEDAELIVQQAQPAIAAAEAMRGMKSKSRKQ